VFFNQRGLADPWFAHEQDYGALPASGICKRIFKPS
jgi:hypothetical protein